MQPGVVIPLSRSRLSGIFNSKITFFNSWTKPQPKQYFFDSFLNSHPPYIPSFLIKILLATRVRRIILQTREASKCMQPCGITICNTTQDYQFQKNNSKSCCPRNMIHERISFCKRHAIRECISIWLPKPNCIWESIIFGTGCFAGEHSSYRDILFGTLMKLGRDFFIGSSFLIGIFLRKY